MKKEKIDIGLYQAKYFLRDILQELRETTNSKEIPDRISNDSPFLLIDRDF